MTRKVVDIGLKFYIGLSVLCLIVLITAVGCRKVSNKETDHDESISNTVTQDNFEITVTASKESYLLKKLFTTEPLNISATVNYIGEEDKIEIWHSIPLCSILLISKDEKTEIGGEFLDVKLSSYIEKDRLYTFNPDFQNEYYKSELVKGQYKAVARIKLSLDEAGTESVDFTTEVSFDIQ